ncbi:hypothetical protein VB636_02030 [Paracoccus sp. APAP_BH8]|uniref:hypothetical protein n=1 Tax=Paracoccus sp. APAP_BH8 TaxID=3110237 RepID=UPI002FD7CA2C
MSDQVEDIRKQVQALPMAGKTLLLGVRKERIFLEFSSGYNEKWHGSQCIQAIPCLRATFFGMPVQVAHVTAPFSEP